MAAGSGRRRGGASCYFQGETGGERLARVSQGSPGLCLPPLCRVVGSSVSCTSRTSSQTCGGPHSILAGSMCVWVGGGVGVPKGSWGSARPGVRHRDSGSKFQPAGRWALTRTQRRCYCELRRFQGPRAGTCTHSSASPRSRAAPARHRSCFCLRPSPALREAPPGAAAGCGWRSRGCSPAGGHTVAGAARGPGAPAPSPAFREVGQGWRGPRQWSQVASAHYVRMTLGKSPPVPEPQRACLQHGEVEPTPRGRRMKDMMCGKQEQDSQVALTLGEGGRERQVDGHQQWRGPRPLGSRG